MNRGEIWMYHFKAPDKRRPVVILSRNDIIPLLHTVVVAPITSTIYGVPSEVLVGIDNGLNHSSTVNCDHLQTVSKGQLHTFVGSLRPEQLDAVCRAVAIALGCETTVTTPPTK